MGTMKHRLLVLAALTLMVTATPALADSGREGGVRGGHRVERWEHQRHEREGEGRNRWGRRSFGFVYPVPYVAPYCYTQDGYWGWDGWQYVWVPPQTVCE